MRIVEQIPHPDFRLVIYATDNQFIVEIEAGPMRQAYRFSKERFPTVEVVKACIQEPWLENVRSHFNGMYVDWKKTWE
ncbi:MAG: hypothetical protein P8N56_06350 [Schleiferiaceae bacterium]|nr:hypothetical protein [Schleiferiaceae bacterium]